eukprot:557736-Hanusia_phi.AAC.1
MPGKFSFAVAGLLVILHCSLGLHLEMARTSAIRIRAATAKLHPQPRCLDTVSLRLRGGEQEQEQEQEQGQDTLLGRLKNNRSLNPSDHPNQLEWLLALLLSAYIAIGAPFSEYVPMLQELVKLPEKERELTASPSLDAEDLSVLTRLGLRPRRKSGWNGTAYGRSRKRSTRSL